MHKKLAWLVAVCFPMTLAAAYTTVNLTKALEAQRQLAAQRPGDARVFNDLGNLLALAGEAGQAEEAYERALALAPEEATFHFNLALLHQQQGRVDKAIASYRRVLELRPDHAWAHYQLGILLARRGAQARAIHHYARAFALNYDLTRPEVNPHVVENELLTEAMMAAYEDISTRPQAPQVYSEPQRIAELLVPSPASLMAEGSPAPDARPPAPAAPPTTTRPASGPRMFADEEDRGEDEEDGEKGEGRTTPATAPTPATPRTFVHPGLVGRGNSGTRDAEPARPGESRTRVLTPTSRPSVDPADRYRPTLRSTGNLELRLVRPDRAPADRPTR